MYVTTRPLPVPVALLETKKRRVLVFNEGSIPGPLLGALKALLRHL
jgi:hypothetical protein